MSLLDDIIQNKKREILKSQKEMRLSELFDEIRGLPNPRPFPGVLNEQESVAVVAEIKKASPSAGTIRPDFDPVAIAESYEQNGATAISVLTDKKYFGGCKNHLQAVREKVALPLLRKDFILDPYQVIEARAFGADAILLILNVLSKHQCLELAAAARECELAFLIEVHTIKELESALCEDFTLIGINNRDLSTFEVDLSTTERLIEIIPRDVTAVSESGIKSRKDVERLGAIGLNAVLIGETLMREEDVGAALKNFIGVTRCPR